MYKEMDNEIHVFVNTCICSLELSGKPESNKFSLRPCLKTSNDWKSTATEEKSPRYVVTVWQKRYRENVSVLKLSPHVHVCIYDMHVCGTRSSTPCTGPTHSNKQCTPVCVTLSSSVVPLQFQQTLISYNSLFLRCTDVKSIFLESTH